MIWQPIETAPMDTPVLIWDGQMMATAYCWAFESSPERKHWSIHGASGYEFEEEFDAPTHWMPLPEPPHKPADNFLIFSTFAGELEVR